jgi:cytochrome c oxidase subunit 3
LAIQRTGRIRVVAQSRREPLIPNGVMGMLIFVFAELMLFGGLISAFVIIKSASVVWPPPNQPRLPFQETAFNTGLLLVSGVLLYHARRVFDRDRLGARLPLLLSALCGAGFLVLQGREWIALLRQGLTLTSSPMGSFFYLIIGIHGLHVTAALALLVATWARLQRGWLASSQLAAAEVFWYFVVGIWPMIYLVVYR